MRGWAATAAVACTRHCLDLRIVVTIALALVLNSGLVFPLFFRVNLVDGAAYPIEAQRFMNAISEGHPFLPRFQWNPLVTLLYAVFYAPLHAYAYWYLAIEWVARVTGFILLWVSLTLIAGRLRKLAHPRLLLALALVTLVVCQR